MLNPFNLFGLLLGSVAFIYSGHALFYAALHGIKRKNGKPNITGKSDPKFFYSVMLLWVAGLVVLGIGLIILAERMLVSG
jgi:hypothetical protein